MNQIPNKIIFFGISEMLLLPTIPPSRISTSYGASGTSRGRPGTREDNLDEHAGFFFRKKSYYELHIAFVLFSLVKLPHQ